MNKNREERTFPKDQQASNHLAHFSTIDVAKMALDSADVGIWIIDSSTRAFFPSERTKELFGFNPEEEMSFEDAFAQGVKKYRKSALRAMDKAFKKHSNLYLEYPISGHHDHKHRWISIKGGFSSGDPDNNYFSGIVMDITEQKQNDLRRSKFIGIVSHELKTPLTALKAYVQLLNSWASKQKDSFTIGALSKVEKQVKKMLNMINSLLNLSGAEAGKIPLVKQDLILNDLIKEVVDETLFITSSHNIVMAPCEEITVNADREKIEQVLVNLLSNAAKYSSQNAPIEIECAMQGPAVEVSIKDQGLGIAAAEIDKLFLPHYRVESRETENITGFGIGLYLCSEIIHRHKGKIWAESEPGKGSTFKFTLPIY
jgi:signal transduction histidine kinase